MSHEDPVQDALEKVGIHVESRPVEPIPHIIATGVGSLIGSLAAGAVGLGPIGRAIGSIGGAIVGHVAITHRIVEPTPKKDPAEPESPAAVSDRR